MLNALQHRLQHRREEEGFTLIELMVVVLIIAILIAIAIPTFLGARTRAQDRAAQSSLRNTLAAAKTIYTDSETYASATTTNLASAEPSLTFQTAASASQNQISVDSPATDTFIAAAMSASDECFWIRDRLSSGTDYGTGGGCEAAATTGVQWKPKW